MKLLEVDLEIPIILKSQTLRWFSFCNNLPEQILDSLFFEWSQNVVETDITIRWAFQRQVYLQGGVQALEESLALSADDDRKSMEEFQSQLDAYMQELQSLNTEYTICSR